MVKGEVLLQAEDPSRGASSQILPSTAAARPLLLILPFFSLPFSLSFLYLSFPNKYVCDCVGSLGV